MGNVTTKAGLISVDVWLDPPGLPLSTRRLTVGAHSGLGNGGATLGIGLGLSSDRRIAVSSLVDSFRSLEWWTNEQKKRDGVRHSGRFYARLMSMETKMDRACGGHWRGYAHNRKGWAALGETWIKQQDLAWCSGLQLSVMDATAEG